MSVASVNLKAGKEKAVANGNGNGNAGRTALEIIISVLVAANLAMTTARWKADADWKVKVEERVRTTEVTLAQITANRFTSSDGYKLTLALTEVQALVAANTKEILHLQKQIEKGS